MRYWSAIISFVWTGWVFGVEFGPARVQTGVGEPLEIRLSIVNLGEVQSTQLFPLLAAESAFTAQGIQRLEVLSELTYIIDVNEKEIDLVIRTATPWDQPELTSLVEIFTPNGSLLVPVSVVLKSKLEEPEKMTTEGSGILIIKPGTQKVVESKIAKSLKVFNGDTLWRLGLRVQPAGSTVEQVMMALYDSNPGAFEFGNVNALEKGKVLVVPENAVITAQTALEAKRRFDAHMKNPGKDFFEIGTPLKAKSQSGDVQNSENSITNILIQSPGPIVKEVSLPTEALVPALQNALESASQSEASSGVTEDRISGKIASEVGGLLEKITLLENKLDQVDAKLEALVDRSVADSLDDDPIIGFSEKLFGLIPSEEVVIDFAEGLLASLPDEEAVIIFSEDLLGMIPTDAEFTQFRKTELWLPVVIFSALLTLIIFVFAFRAFRVRVKPPKTLEAAKRDQSKVASLMTDSLEQSAGNYESILVETVPAGDALTNADMLDSAIEQLKMKIEDPSRHEEAEALYQGGDDMLINAFSADALNENPDWGQDLDDEADVAAHQLELARSYLEMGMKETAIELLERVVVSPDRACANQARVMLDAHRA